MNRTRISLSVAPLLFVMIAESATAVLPAPDEMMEARQWTAPSL